MRNFAPCPTLMGYVPGAWSDDQDSKNVGHSLRGPLRPRSEAHPLDGGGSNEPSLVSSESHRASVSSDGPHRETGCDRARGNRPAHAIVKVPDGGGNVLEGDVTAGETAPNFPNNGASAGVESQRTAVREETAVPACEGMAAALPRDSSASVAAALSATSQNMAVGERYDEFQRMIERRYGKMAIIRGPYPYCNEYESGLKRYCGKPALMQGADGVRRCVYHDTMARRSA